MAGGETEGKDEDEDSKHAKDAKDAADIAYQPESGALGPREAEAEEVAERDPRDDL